MAVITSNVLTFTDMATRLGPNNEFTPIIELLNESNPILEDMPWLEGNLPTGHQSTVRTGIPEPTWRKINNGVAPGKSETSQITDTCGLLEANSQIDIELAKLNNMSAQFRLSEDVAQLEGMNHALAKNLFYGDIAVNPERIQGFESRYNTLNVATAKSAENVLNGAVSGSSATDLTSIWLIGWGANTIHGIYPKGSKYGIEVDKGDGKPVRVTDSDGKPFRAYITTYTWKPGLCVRDWRYAVRICNLSIANLSASSGAASLIDLMSEAEDLIPNINMCKPVFYAHKKVVTALRKQLRDKNNVNLTLETAAGKKVVSFDGIPVRKCDALSITESRVA